MINGKIALVTGASRGIGQAIALELARQGADVAVAYAGNQQAALETCAAIEEMGRRAVALCCNVADPAQANAAAEAAIEALGGLDILVNNAGITADGLIPQMSDEDFDRVIAVNLRGTFNMTRAVYRRFMRARSGRIINVTSVSGLMGNAGQANYAAAKAGIVGLTKSTAKELASRGVTCNAVAPGFIHTDMTRAMPQQVLDAATAAIPMRRMGAAQDVAHAVAFLAGDGASYITGEVIKIDGGLYI